MALPDLTNVEAIQQHLEKLGTRHRLRGKSYKNFLQPRHLKDEFKPPPSADGNSSTPKIDDATAEVLFDDFARVVCKANAIPRKELFEAWAMALYVHNHFSSVHSRRIADLACGHGLLSWALMYLDDQCRQREPAMTGQETSPSSSAVARSAICVDVKMPIAVEKIENAMREEFPDFDGRWDYVEGAMECIVSSPSTLVVGIHCCAGLSDKVIDLAVAANAPLALVPCCHTRKCWPKEQKKNLNALLEEKGVTLAEFIDDMRVERLKAAGYTVVEERIPEIITPKNRIILATPPPKDEIQDAGPLLTDPKHALLKKKFTIPIGNSDQARSEVELLSGRDAALLRRRPLPPHLSLSIILPRPDAVTIQDMEELSARVAKDYNFSDNEEMKDATISTSVEFIGTMHERPEGNYSRTYRVHYDIVDDSGKLPQVTKEQAREMTYTICHLVDTTFGEGVVVRQWPGEKKMRKV